MQLNGYEVTDRHNRPNLSSRKALRVVFYNDGQRVDPYAFSGVTVFQKSANITPNTVIDSNNVVAATVVAGDIKAQFGARPRVDGLNLDNSSIAESNYTPNTLDSSSIFKVSGTTGEYICVLDGITPHSAFYGYHGSSLQVTSTADVATDYIDVWLVKLIENSDYQVLISDFTLFNDTFFTTTEPILLKASPKLHTKHITLGSKVDLKITNDTTVANRGLTEEIKNIFKHNVISDPQIKIEKLNEESTLPSRVEVSGFSETAGFIDVTSDNTIVFNWDPEASKSTPEWLNGTFGSLTGAYQITVKYTMLTQTYVSPPFTVIVS